MKDVKLKIIVVVALIATISIAVAIRCERSKIVEVTLELSDAHSFVVPVQINGRTYNMLWDTGTSISYITRDVINELRIDTTDQFVRMRVLQKRQAEQRCYTDFVDFGLGNFEFRTRLLSSSFGKTDSIRNISGVIGSDIINRYTWLFDFENLRVVVSNKSQAVALKGQDQRYDFRLFFHDTIFKISPYLEAQINDTVQELINFDTGFQGGELTLGGAVLNLDMTILMSDTNTPEQVYSYLKSRYSKDVDNVEVNGKRTNVFIRNLTINGYKTTMLNAQFEFDKYYGDHLNRFEREGGLRGDILLGADFLKRFSRMYYDANANRVSLIISASDTTVYGKREIDKFFDVMAKFNK